jgi:hypothetical protein
LELRLTSSTSKQIFTMITGISVCIPVNNKVRRDLMGLLRIKRLYAIIASPTTDTHQVKGVKIITNSSFFKSVNSKYNNVM